MKAQLLLSAEVAVQCVVWYSEALKADVEFHADDDK